jgi:hypothetical protein
MYAYADYNIRVRGTFKINGTSLQEYAPRTLLRILVVATLPYKIALLILEYAI